MTEPSVIRVGFDMRASNYKHKGIRIYRADMFGGTTWGFYYREVFHVCNSMYAARCAIDRLLKDPNDERVRMWDVKLSVAVCGFFEGDKRSSVYPDILSGENE